MSVVLKYYRYGRDEGEEHPDTPSAIRAAAASLEHGEFWPYAIHNVYGTVLLEGEEFKRRMYEAAK